MSFVGTIHSDRLKILNEIEKIAKEKDKKVFFYKYLQSWFMYYYHYFRQKEFRRTKPKDYQYNKLSAKQIIEISQKSRCIVDIQHSNQTGLTMRTFEMLGLKKKLITTNRTIKDYDFYNDNNICIIDPNNIQIPEEFLLTPYEPISYEVYDKYSLKNWVLNLLDCNDSEERK